MRCCLCARARLRRPLVGRLVGAERYGKSDGFLCPPHAREYAAPPGATPLSLSSHTRLSIHSPPPLHSPRPSARPLQASSLTSAALPFAPTQSTSALSPASAEPYVRLELTDAHELRSTLSGHQSSHSIPSYPIASPPFPSDPLPPPLPSSPIPSPRLLPLPSPRLSLLPSLPALMIAFLSPYFAVNKFPKPSASTPF